MDIEDGDWCRFTSRVMHRSIQTSSRSDRLADGHRDIQADTSRRRQTQ